MSFPGSEIILEMSHARKFEDPGEKKNKHGRNIPRKDQGGEMENTCMQINPNRESCLTSTRMRESKI